jgi:hypothetical protein
MPVSFRLKPTEQDALRDKSSQFNLVLVKNGHEPMKDSENLHEVLAKALENAEISAS